MRGRFERKRSAVKAARAGELAPSSEAQNPMVARVVVATGWLRKSVGLTQGGLLGSAKAVGRTTKEGNPMAQQIKDRRVVPKDDRKVIQTVRAGREGVGGDGGGMTRGVMSNRTEFPDWEARWTQLVSYNDATETREVIERQLHFAAEILRRKSISLCASPCAKRKAG